MKDNPFDNTLAELSSDGEGKNTLRNLFKLMPEGDDSYKNPYSSTVSALPADLNEILELMEEARLDLEAWNREKAFKHFVSTVNTEKITRLIRRKLNHLTSLIRSCSQYNEHASKKIGSKYRFETKLAAAENTMRMTKVIFGIE